MSPERPERPPKVTVRHLSEMKRRGERIAALTAHDFLFARMLEEEGVDVILVGDSLAQVALGYDSTLPVTLDEMLHHARAVRKGAPRAFLVLDLPFLSYQVSPEEALRSAGRALKEAGVQGVKVEGADPVTLEAVRRMTRSGIPVMGHLGFQPQSVHALGGYRVQGREVEGASRMVEEGRTLQDAGCFSLVLELVPKELAQRITASLEIPTIGIGAGPHCDGQVLVLADALGLNVGFTPRFLHRFADLNRVARDGIRDYVKKVREGSYPRAEHSFSTEDDPISEDEG